MDIVGAFRLLSPVRGKRPAVGILLLSEPLITLIFGFRRFVVIGVILQVDDKTLISFYFGGVTFIVTDGADSEGVYPLKPAITVYFPRITSSLEPKVSILQLIENIFFSTNIIQIF